MPVLQILNMEKIMLNTLRFNLTVPTPFNFLSRYLKVGGCDSCVCVQRDCHEVW